MFDKSSEVIGSFAEWALEGPEEVREARLRKLQLHLKVLEDMTYGRTPDQETEQKLAACVHITRKHLLTRLAAAGVLTIGLGIAFGNALCSSTSSYSKRDVIPVRSSGR